MLRCELPGGCHLRFFEESDAEALHRVAAANRAHLAEWLPWAQGRISPDTLLEWIRRSRQQIADNNGFQAAIVDGDAIIGVVGFDGVDWNHRSAGIGYWLVEGRQGRGTMTEAVRALTAHAFDTWGLKRVEIRVAVGNVRSAAIPRRLGFTEEGVLRQAERHRDGYKDNTVFSMLADEWRTAR